MTPSLTVADVARDVFSRSADWLRRNWKRLVDEHGFPAPLPPGPRLLWDPDAVQAWRQGRYDARGSELVQRTAIPEPDAGDDLEDARDEVRERLAIMTAASVGAE